MKLAVIVLGLTLPVQAQEPARPRITGLAHIALRVSDIEKSRAFYKEFLGFGEPFSLNNQDGSLALTFFVFLYRDTAFLNRMEANTERLTHEHRDRFLTAQILGRVIARQFFSHFILSIHPPAAWPPRSEACPAR